jgi:hypothetical protein
MLFTTKIGIVKLTVPVQLYAGAAGGAALRDTLALCNEAATLVSARALEMGVTGRQALQRLVYADLRAMGLSRSPRSTSPGRSPVPMRPCGRTSGPGTSASQARNDK